MLELFKVLWAGWGKVVRGIVQVQNAVLMTVAYILGLAPVALGMKLLGKHMLDRAPADPKAASHWVPRDPQPMDMQKAARQF